MLTKKRAKELIKIMEQKGLNKTSLATALGYKSRTIVTNVLNCKMDSPTVEKKIINLLEE